MQFNEESGDLEEIERGSLLSAAKNSKTERSCFGNKSSRHFLYPYPVNASCAVLVVPTLAIAKVGTTLCFTEYTGWAWDHWRGHPHIER
jgi:hypothetical protein